MALLVKHDDDDGNAVGLDDGLSIGIEMAVELRIVDGTADGCNDGEIVDNEVESKIGLWLGDKDDNAGIKDDGDDDGKEHWEL
jgi:hypothetical protein